MGKGPVISSSKSNRLLISMKFQVLKFSHGFPYFSVMEVDEIIIHANWSWSWLQNDYAIIKLKESIKFSNKANAACLPNWTNSSTMDDQILTISGWGLVDKG